MSHNRCNKDICSYPDCGCFTDPSREKMSINWVMKCGWCQLYLNKPDLNGPWHCKACGWRSIPNENK